MPEYAHILNHSVMITLFVFVMMLMVDYVNVLTNGKFSTMIQVNKFRQYTLSSFLSATPGCLGAFMNVSFYVHGLITFGAMVGAMIATSGDEAYVMLKMFPKTAIALFLLLFGLGIVFAYITDRLAPLFKIAPREKCKLAPLHLADIEHPSFDITIWRRFPKVLFLRFIILMLIILAVFLTGFGIIGPKSWDWERITVFILLFVTAFLVTTTPDHYLKEHIWKHIIKKHIWRIFLWTLAALFIIDIGLKYWQLSEFAQTNTLMILFISALIGIIPESGPHLIFVTMFAKGLIPFSVLLTSSIVQDGHGILPLFSYSIKDAILIKSLNVLFGICVGLVFYLVGL